jgi:hypothetical protein
MNRPALLFLLCFPIGCNPNYESGTTACSNDGNCPSGFECRADWRCYTQGSGPMSGGSSGNGGLGGAGGMGPCGRGCPGGQTCCSGTCVDLTINASNCGACGQACSNGSCYEGVCCTPGQACGACPSSYPYYVPCTGVVNPCWSGAVSCASLSQCSDGWHGCTTVNATYVCLQEGSSAATGACCVSGQNCSACSTSSPFFCGPNSGLPNSCWSGTVDCSNVTHCSDGWHGCSTAGLTYNCSTKACAKGGGGTGGSSGSCIRFEACVDGSDLLTLQGGKLSIQHETFDPFGKNADCSGLLSTVNPATSLYNATDGVFAIDGTPHPLSASPIQVAISQVTSFNAIQARESVAWSGTNQILIDDDDSLGAAVYVIDLCSSAGGSGGSSGGGGTASGGSGGSKSGGSGGSSSGGSTSGACACTCTCSGCSTNLTCPAGDSRCRPCSTGCQDSCGLLGCGSVVSSAGNCL